MNPSVSEISLNFEHSFAEQLPDFFAEVSPDSVPSPRLLQFNQSLASELNLDLGHLTPDVATRIFSGKQLPKDAKPIAQAYAGHQFGGFVPQLGDGRAMLMGEVIDQQENRRDIALKGSGRTPYSRGGDGKAAIGPVLREYLIGESMHALGIPTTRALAAVATGENVMREVPLPGAVLTRVAASHVRVGTFQFFAARRQYDQVQELADYVIKRHYSSIFDDDNRYLSLLRSVADRQADLIARWMLIGFIHGVMNTDNMTISGETIDYGPCAFMEAYDPQTVFSSIDRGGRYAYANQPTIALWNLARFAETLLPLVDENSERAVSDVTEILETFMPGFEQYWYKGAIAKLGLVGSGDADTVSGPIQSLVDDWLELLQTNKADFTIAWRHLADAAVGCEDDLRSLFSEQVGIDLWLARWRKMFGANEPVQIAKAIRAANPLYIPRNHLVEEALAAASDNNDLSLFESLLEIFQNPFEKRLQHDRFATPAPAQFTACYRTFCGT